MTQTTGKRRGHGEDSIYWDESRSRYIGAVDLGFSPAGTRIRKKVSGKTKVEVRDKLRELQLTSHSAASPPPTADRRNGDQSGPVPVARRLRTGAAC
jgi:hypothetical protein